MTTTTQSPAIDGLVFRCRAEAGQIAPSAPPADWDRLVGQAACTVRAVLRVHARPRTLGATGRDDGALPIGDLGELGDAAIVAHALALWARETKLADPKPFDRRAQIALWGGDDADDPGLVAQVRGHGAPVAWWVGLRLEHDKRTASFTLRNAPHG